MGSFFFPTRAPSVPVSPQFVHIRRCSQGADQIFGTPGIMLRAEVAPPYHLAWLGNNPVTRIEYSIHWDMIATCQRGSCSLKVLPCCIRPRRQGRLMDFSFHPAGADDSKACVRDLGIKQLAHFYQGYLRHSVCGVVENCAVRPTTRKEEHARPKIPILRTRRKHLANQM